MIACPVLIWDIPCIFQTLYRLKVSQYHGDAGDSIPESVYSGAAFSTIDKDNDVWSKHCAVEMRGAWWYTDCHQANLNGYNYDINDTVEHEGEGIIWKTFTTYDYALKSDIMAIRPLNL